MGFLGEFPYYKIEKKIQRSFPVSLVGDLLFLSTIFRDAIRSLTSTSCTSEKFMAMPDLLPHHLRSFHPRQDEMFVTDFLMLRASA